MQLATFLFVHTHTHTHTHTHKHTHRHTHTHARTHTHTHTHNHTHTHTSQCCVIYSKKEAKNERLCGYLNSILAIKQGYDRPVSVTTDITRPLAPFTGTCNVETNNRHLTELVMVSLVIMGLLLVLMESEMVSTGIWSPSIGGLLKPISPNGICPKTHYRKHFNG